MGAPTAQYCHKCDTEWQVEDHLAATSKMQMYRSPFELMFCVEPVYLHMTRIRTARQIYSMIFSVPTYREFYGVAIFEVFTLQQNFQNT